MIRGVFKVLKASLNGLTNRDFGSKEILAQLIKESSRELHANEGDLLEARMLKVLKALEILILTLKLLTIILKSLRDYF